MTTTRDPLADALRDALAAEPASIDDDRALIARAIAGAAAATAPKVVPAARPRSIAVRAALPLTAALAASITLAAIVIGSRSEAPSTAALGEAPAAPASPAPMPPVLAAPAESTTPGPSVSVNDLPTARPSAIAAPRPVETTATPAELFRDANAERRAGNTAKAIELYRTLQRAHPGAAEAQASRVSLGRLLLDRQGDPTGALTQFEAYLKGAPTDGGSLAEEARVGRALALQRLGRSDEERRAWEELLVRHPQSLQGAQARERIGILTTPR